LNASGGDLAIDKCVIVFLLYKTICQKGKSMVVLKSVDEETGDISLQPFDQEADRINIRRITTEEGERYLGVQAAGDGNWRDEYSFRLKQMKGMASKITHSSLDRNSTYTLYSTTYKPTICYPLHHTTFSNNECDKLQSPTTQAILPKMGFNRNFPRAVVHGPYSLGGNQLIDLKVEQFVLQITDMMTAVRKMDIIGEQLVYLIAAHQRFLGSSTQFFSTSHEDFTYRCRNSRMSFIWEKIQKYGIEITSKHFWVPNSDFDNDSALMDVFIVLRKRRQNTPQHSTSNDLHNPNEVRLYLKCTYLSDILYEKHSIRQEKYDASSPYDTIESYPRR
jgi:hypothetical protein